MGSLIPLCGFLSWNSGRQAHQQAPLPAEHLGPWWISRSLCLLSTLYGQVLLALSLQNQGFIYHLSSWCGIHDHTLGFNNLYSLIQRAIVDGACLIGSRICWTGDIFKWNESVPTPSGGHDLNAVWAHMTHFFEPRMPWYGKEYETSLCAISPVGHVNSGDMLGYSKQTKILLNLFSAESTASYSEGFWWTEEVIILTPFGMTTLDCHEW